MTKRFFRGSVDDPLTHTPYHTAPDHITLPHTAPHFCDWVLRRHAASGPVNTTLDPDLQSLARQTLARHHEQLSTRGIHSGAIVIIETKTGKLRAMVGSPVAGSSITSMRRAASAIFRRISVIFRCEGSQWVAALPVSD